MATEEALKVDDTSDPRRYYSSFRLTDYLTDLHSLIECHFYPHSNDLALSLVLSVKTVIREVCHEGYESE
jgi:hypothetical protein